MDELIVAFFVEVLLNAAMSLLVGAVSEDQLAAVFQLLSPPPPSQVLVAASACTGRSANAPSRLSAPANIAGNGISRLLRLAKMSDAVEVVRVADRRIILAFSPQPFLLATCDAFTCHLPLVTPFVLCP